MEVLKRFLHISVLIVLQLFSVYSLELPELRNEHTTLVSDRLAVEYTPIYRRRRSLSNGQPTEIHAKFSTEDGGINLKFEKTKIRQNEISIHYYYLGEKYAYTARKEQKQCVSIYQDLDSRATALIDFCVTIRSTPQMLIELPINNTQHVIMTTVPKDGSGENVHRLYRVEEPDSWTFKDYNILETNPPTQSKNHNVIGPGRHRRAALTFPHTVELLLVIDYSLYNFWYEQTTGTNRQQQTFDNIRNFYAFVVSAMDLRYQGLSTSGLNIRVELVAIKIITTSADSPWIETNLDNPSISPGSRGSFDGKQALQDFTSWIANQKATDPQFPENDHAMLLTARDLQIDDSAGAAGFANLEAICSSQSQSIAEDHFNFLSITILTHELGHSLGAYHDGDGNACSGTDYFIMAAANSALTGTKSRNPWLFSLCSANAIKTKMTSLNSNGDSDNCLITKENNDVIGTSGQVLGQKYSLNKQCENSLLDTSFLCQALHLGKTESLCTGIWCAIAGKLSNCTLVLPADGTTCGDKKWCINGNCVPDNNAPAADETCLFGDQVGAIVNDGTTCADFVTSDKSRCYGEDVRGICCTSCESAKTGITGCDYGDRSACSQINAQSCYDLTLRTTDCCETCERNFKRNDLPEDCAYGDRAVNCVATTSSCAINAHLCCDTCKDILGTPSTSPTAAPPSSSAPPTASSSTNAPPVTTTVKSDRLEDWVIPVAAVGGGLLLIGIIVGVICCCRKSQPDPKHNRHRGHHGNRHRNHDHARNKPPRTNRHGHGGHNAYNNPAMNYHYGASRY